MRMRTSSAAIKALLDVLSKVAAMRTTYGLSCVAVWKTSSIHLELKREYTAGLWNSPQDRIHTHLVENAHYKVSILDRKKWENGFGPKKHVIIGFADNLKIKDYAGTRCCGQQSEDGCVLRLDCCNSGFQAEVLAFKKNGRILLG